jgi:hypothetical protein
MSYEAECSDQQNLYHTSHSADCQGFSSAQHRRATPGLSYSAIFILLFLLGCAPLVPSPPIPPFSHQKTAQLISNLRAQGEKIVTFQGIGKVRFKDREEESELNLLAVGCRPFKIRAEISHPWGKPLFFVVVDGDNASALSLVDKRFFRGQSSLLPIDLFFLLRLDPDTVWHILAGTVPILPYSNAASLKPYEISLYNGEGEVTQMISFFPRSLLPRSISFPYEGITILLSDFKQGQFGPRPLRIEIARKDTNQSLEIRYKNLTHNKPIPEGLFSLEPPPGFEVIELNE